MIDNLTEAIAHAKEKARELNNTADNWKWLSDEKGLDLPSDYEPCKKCASEHEQLAEWLEELKAVKDIVDHWNDENSSFVSATIAFEKILDVFKESEATNETD